MRHSRTAWKDAVRVVEEGGLDSLLNQDLVPETTIRTEPNTREKVVDLWAKVLVSIIGIGISAILIMLVVWCVKVVYQGTFG